MISLKIGSNERQNDNISNQWIAQQIRNRKKANQPICVTFRIRKDDVNLLLQSDACSKGINGSGPPPNKKESRLIELWNDKGLNSKKINPGMLISFLKQYERYC